MVLLYIRNSSETMQGVKLKRRKKKKKATEEDKIFAFRRNAWLGTTACITVAFLAGELATQTHTLVVFQIEHPTSRFPDVNVIHRSSRPDAASVSCSVVLGSLRSFPSASGSVFESLVEVGVKSER